MEDMINAEGKHPRPNSYSFSQPQSNSVLRMPPADPALLHSYQTPQSALPPSGPPGGPMQYAGNTWAPPPSPYGSHDHQQPPSEVSHHPANPHNYHPPSREHSTYPPDANYGRTGSISSNNRSPGDAPPPNYAPVNGHVPDGHYQAQHGLPDLRTRSSYGPPESPGPGAPPPGLHLVTGPETMTGQPQSMPPMSQYGPPPPPAGPGPSPIYPPEYYGPHPMSGYAYSTQRRKPIRASQACDSCRQRKAKCDEGRPECQHCKDNSLKCFYREVPLQKQDKQAAALTEKLDNMDDKISRLVDQNDKINRIIELQEAQARQIEYLQTLLPADKRAALSRRDTVDQTMRTPPVKDEHAGARQSSVNHMPAAPPPPFEIMKDPNATEEHALPVKHTTAAQNLLKWASIKPLIRDDISETYVIDFETSRGLLRLYGCGEGEDKNDGGCGAASPAGSSESGGRTEDELSTPSPGGVWGSGQLPGRSPGPGPSTRDHAGGVSPHGGLVLDTDVVSSYYKSYMEHMHILQPFLERKVLQGMVHKFVKRYSWDQLPLQHRGLSTGKRKRVAEDSPPFGGDLPANQLHQRTHNTNSAVVPEIEHSITNAIVLLVLALGKICAHKAPIPGPMSTSSIPTSTPQTVHPDLHMSPSAPNSPPPRPDARFAAPALPISSPSDPRGKNMDVIPGLAYFAVASDILGELPGGSDVSHIQANLLAGLYMGQLARIFPAHHYIATACKSCLVLIESAEYKKKLMKPARRNLINFAFWTSLQLESDILAEVELPPSGITRKESKMLSEMPTGVTLDAGDEHDLSPNRSMDVLRFYSYQIQLRRTLNEIHFNLYQGEVSHKPNFKLIEALDENLEDWRRQLQDWDWEDDDHRSPDVNTARMRGKYYGAKYIIHRPALHYALHSGSTGTPRSHPSESPVHAPGYQSQHASPAITHSQAGGAYARRASEMGPPMRFPDTLDHTVKAAAEACVQAAIRSTTAFDAVPERLIITNIFGTAHAQFGNILVLAATYTSGILPGLIDEKTLRALFERTIRILRYNEGISPTLKYEAGILEGVRDRVFHPGGHGPSASTHSSFSSS